MAVTKDIFKVLDLDKGDYKFESVNNFKYLGVDINKDANSHEEIKLRLAVANSCYFELIGTSI